MSSGEWNETIVAIIIIIRHRHNDTRAEQQSQRQQGNSKAWKAQNFIAAIVAAVRLAVIGDVHRVSVHRARCFSELTECERTTHERTTARDTATPRSCHELSHPRRRREAGRPLALLLYIHGFTAVASMSARSKKKTKPGQAPLSEALQECFEILKFLQVTQPRGQ